MDITATKKRTQCCKLLEKVDTDIFCWFYNTAVDIKNRNMRRKIMRCQTRGIDQKGPERMQRL
jgi:succinate dehydrogenase flavin-adding protein (antitoxin of CptAB toxin-antitoxin module)